MDYKEILKRFLSVGLLVAGLVIVVVGWHPLYRWYLGMEYLPGVDFYVSATHARQLLDHFNLPPLVWKYYWYSGYPFSQGYLIFHFYLMLPFVKFLGLVRGVQIYAMASLLLFSLACYLLFSRVSKNRLFAALLALATTYSASLYGALLWAGGIPSFATQTFLPLTLFLLIGYFQKEERHWLYLAGLSLGFSVLGHPRVFLIHLFLISLFYVVFYPYQKGKFLLIRRIKDGFLFYLITFFVGLIQIYPLLISTLKVLFVVTKQTVSAVALGGETAVRGVFSSHPQMIIVGTNQFIFIALAFLAVLFGLRIILIQGRKKALVGAFGRLYCLKPRAPSQHYY